MSVGQEFLRPRRVVVLIEDYDGQQHGWEVTDGRASWSFEGIGWSEAAGTGTKATMTVTGRFHRRTRGVRLEEFNPAELEG